MSEDGGRPAREQFNRTVPAAEFLAPAATDLGSTRVGREESAAAGQPELSGQGLGRRLSEQGLPSVGPTGARFAVENLLGVGANGQVYAVIDQNLDRPLAAKFLKSERPDLETIEHFVDEARITASLQHPNVLPVYELDISSRGEIYFTMKRIDGASLGGALTASTAEVRSRAIAQMNDIVAIFISVAQALSYAHHRGIIHQDIKPDNIMLGDFGEVLLVDWGSAIRVDDPHPKLYGTPLYMSPEQARLERPDTRSDIYALGASLFHTLTVRPPTWSDDAEEFWKRKRSGEIDAPTVADRQRLPPALLAIALKALAPDPAGRYQTAADFRQDLQQYQAGLAVSALRDNWLARFRRWHRRHAKRVWSTAAAAAVILTLGLLLYGERLKEVATWGQPLVDETFTDGGWKDRWETATGEWTAGDGGIHTEGSENILLCKTRLSGDIAVQYDAEIAIGARPGDISAMWIPDATMFRTNRESGLYYCQIGARDDTFSAISSDHQYLAYSDFRPRPGVLYRIRLEIVDNQMTMSVDGRQVCRFINQMPFTGGRVALYGYFPGKIYHRVRIYTRRIAQKLPATAIGDAYLRDGQYAKGITEYRQVEDSYPGTALARQATFREGLCRYRSGDHAAAFARWQTLRGTDLDEVARLHDLDRLNEQGDHGRMLADMAQLYRSGSEEIRTRVALLWSTYVQNLLREILRPEVLAQLTDLLRLRDEIFPDEGATSMLAASALIRIDRAQEVLERFSQQPVVLAEALNALGRADEVMTRFPSLDALHMMSYHLSGQTEKILPDYEFDFALGRIERGEAEAMFAAGVRTLAVAVASGHYDEVLQHQDAATHHHLLALLYTGRTAELSAQQRTSVEAMMAERRVDEALAQYGWDFAFAMWPRHLKGLECWIAGDHARAEELFAVSPQARYHQSNFHIAHWVIVPFLRELAGDRDAIARACAEAKERRYAYEQKPWWNARYLCGEIDDATYLAQSHRQFAEADLLLLKAVLAERSGATAEAADRYHAWQAIPPNRRAPVVDPVLERFVEWRLAQSAEAPAQVPTP